VDALKRKKKPETPATKYEMPEGPKDMDDLLSTLINALETPSIWSQLNVAMATRLDSDGKNKESAELADQLIYSSVRGANLLSDASKRFMPRYKEIAKRMEQDGGPPAKEEEAA
jgi:hypothetical protein